MIIDEYIRPDFSIFFYIANFLKVIYDAFMKKLITLSILFSSLLICLSPLQAREMRGMYSYMADTGLFLECGTDKRQPVAMEGDNMALESAYLQNRYMPGKSLLVTFDGHTALRPKMEGDGQQQVIIVDRFISIAQQERCNGTVPPSSLTNTYWKLVELNNNKLTLNTGSKEPHMIIRGKNKIKGFSGCNNFSGQVIFDSSSIQINSLISSQMFCPAMTLETRFQKNLAQADYYQIKGESLVLFSNDQPIAKFIAVYF